MRVVKLTPRQHQVLLHFLSGMTMNEIADEMGLSPRTVEQHMKKIRIASSVGRLQELRRLHAQGLLKVER